MVENLFAGEAPFAKHIVRMWIRGCKQTFNLYPVVDGFGKTLELTFMHILTYKLIQSPSQARFLGRAGRHVNDDLVFFFVNIVPHQDTPWKIPECLDKSL